MPFGNGSDGALRVLASTTYTLSPTATPVEGSAGSAAVRAARGTGLQSGQLVMLHQTQGTNAGVYELATISTVSGSAVTLSAPLARTYSSSGIDHAQLVVVPQYTTVTLETASVLNTRAWDGETGGILAFEANGIVSINGVADASGLGFRGYSHASSCTSNAPYRCANGYAGESANGVARPQSAANGSGGGGGTQGQDCAGGGGGAYGSSGVKGSDGSALGNCILNGANPGGAAGSASGNANLAVNLLFGAAGGEGGADEDGAYPGRGGNGGGVVWMAAPIVNVVSGGVRANGASGGAGANGLPCQGGGYGMGGGGGGAGGASRILATSASLGAPVTATGGQGGVCSDQRTFGGAGGAGRIAIGAIQVTGSTTPLYYGG